MWHHTLISVLILMVHLQWTLAVPVNLIQDGSEPPMNYDPEIRLGETELPPVIQKRQLPPIEVMYEIVNQYFTFPSEATSYPNATTDNEVSQSGHNHSRQPEQQKHESEQPHLDTVQWQSRRKAEKMEHGADRFNTQPHPTTTPPTVITPTGPFENLLNPASVLPMDNETEEIVED
ncbi:unnamed protein product [Echinostoma caproni]|uniref:Secreted protein n=1 Tax=Echinostoma caproni TaxID=27848 RepID=A0A183AH19_9TREM|nr:unnamed protein product [Echinostoma caproni]